MVKAFYQKNKAAFYAAGCITLAAVNAYAYFGHFEDHLKLRDYTASQQLLYNPEFLDEGYAADALIRECVRGREVIVPRGLTPYNQYASYGHMHDTGNPFSMEYFWENNYIKYFSEYASGITVNTELPDLYELEEKPLAEDIASDFVLLGPGNDMMRYAHMGDHTEEETSNQFYYTYFYTVDPGHPEGEELQIRMCTEGMEDAGRLVALWDTGENLYLMSEAYYNDRVAGGYK
ncbi:MAG: hypothetical protein J5966_02945 [Lachnospiraceae bacterium]|nr:hypothetical protein [Lachnospiraceae bacterium]